MNPDEKKLQARAALIALLAIGAMTPDGEPRYSAELEWMKDSAQQKRNTDDKKPENRRADDDRS